MLALGLTRRVVAGPRNSEKRHDGTGKAGPHIVTSLFLRTYPPFHVRVLVRPRIESRTNQIYQSEDTR